MIRKKIVSKKTSSFLVTMVSIVLEMREVKAIRRWFEGSDLSPFLGIGKLCLSVQEEGKIPRL